MVLPNEYISYEEYFLEGFNFLKQNQILYNYANINILTEDILTTVKVRNDFNNFKSTDRIRELYKGPHNLLNVDNNVVLEINELYDRNEIRGLSKKKLHEIYRLSDVIHRECSRLNISSVVDLGCGLGYLSQLLHEKYGYNIIGIEGDERRVIAAIDRQKKQFQKSIEAVKYIHLFITEESVIDLEENVQKFFKTDECFILTGLHACGDLTIDAIKLFLSMKNCQGLIIMPCCYHKMKESKSDGKLINMPLSDAMGRAYQKHDAGTFLRQPLLRLACQRSQRGWNEDMNQHRIRIFNLLSRAVLQLYAKNENLKIIKKKKSNRNDLNSCDFSMYLESISNRYKLCEDSNTNLSASLSESNYTAGGSETNKTAETSTSGETEIKENISMENISRIELDREKIMGLWKALTPEDFSSAELLMLLQDGMQAFCENIVLLDKIAFLDERQSEKDNLKFGFVKVTDDKISPRCYALVATK